MGHRIRGLASLTHGYALAPLRGNVDLQDFIVRCAPLQERGDKQNEVRSFRMSLDEASVGLNRYPRFDRTAQIERDAIRLTMFKRIKHALARGIFVGIHRRSLSRCSRACFYGLYSRSMWPFSSSS